jgi:hypothetical protein
VPKPKYTSEQVNKAAELREQGLSCGAIAEQVGMTERSVYWHCIKLGADSPLAAANAPRPRKPITVQRGNHIVRQFTPQDDKQLLALEAEGLTPAMIAQRMGRKRNSIVGRMMTIAFKQERAESLTDA